MNAVVAGATSADVCARVKRLGYAASKRIRMYGEEFELLSDPFLEDGNVAVRAKGSRDENARILRLPATLLQNARHQLQRAA